MFAFAAKKMVVFCLAFLKLHLTVEAMEHAREEKGRTGEDLSRSPLMAVIR
jgi:hypothetical protein